MNTLAKLSIVAGLVSVTSLAGAAVPQSARSARLGADETSPLWGSSRARGDEQKEADATCYSATAILLPGDGQNEETRVSLIRAVLAESSDWKRVDEIPQNRVGDVAIVRYDVRSTYRGGPTVVYTGACGHGGTCNDVAKKFAEKHPEVKPEPAVHCGDLSNVLVNPQVLR